MKLELKYLKGYLGTGLKLKYSDGEEFTMTALTESNGVIYCNGVNISEEKPLLLPLSALTEPLPDGSIPIVELAKIATNLVYGGLIDFSKAELLSESDNAGLIVYYEKERISFTADFDCTRKSFSLFLDGSESNLNQLQLFEYLYSIHADLNNLIDAGLAIDKRTVI